MGTRRGIKSVGRVAYLIDGEWTGDSTLVDFLTGMMVVVEEEPSPSIPDYDWYAIQEILKTIDGPYEAFGKPTRIKSNGPPIVF